MMANPIQRSTALDEEAHICFLDATSVYDCVSMWTLNIAFRRLGTPEDFIAWIRKTVAGHSRIVSACVGARTGPNASPSRASRKDAPSALPYGFY